MIETRQGTLWSFPAGWLMHERDVKGYAVEAADGHVGTVAWASYEPGESYLVVRHRQVRDEAYYVLPAGAVELVDDQRRLVELQVGVEAVRGAPRHETPDAPLDWSNVAELERRMLGVWPY
jgi:8-oxo-dGTP pyrophosphatase MutT (NUDIX family)